MKATIALSSVKSAAVLLYELKGLNGDMLGRSSQLSKGILLMIKRVLRRILSHPYGNKHKGIFFRRRAQSAGLTLRAGNTHFDLEKDNKVLRLGSSHTVYLPEMIANFDHYFDSVIPIQEGSKQIT